MDEAGVAAGQRLRRDFTNADLAIIAKAKNLMPPRRLLGLLNDRLHAEVGGGAVPYTMDQLMAVAGGGASTAVDDRQQWASLRRRLAAARADGTLSKITRETVQDFAIVFSLTPRQVVLLTDTLFDQDGDVS